MKLKAMTKWYVQSSLPTLGIMFGVLLLLYLVQIVLNAISDPTLRVSQAEITAYISLFVLGVIFFPTGLRLGCVSSVSRKTSFLGFVCGAVITGTLTAGCNILLILLSQLNGFGQANVRWVFESIYPAYRQQGSPAAALLINFLWLIASYVAGMMTGYFIAGVFYRLGHWGRIFWAAGLPVGLFAVLPAVLALLPLEVQKQLLNAGRQLMGFLAASPWNTLLFFIITAALFGGISWLLIRRAPLKAGA